MLDFECDSPELIITVSLKVVFQIVSACQHLLNSRFVSFTFDYLTIFHHYQARNILKSLRGAHDLKLYSRRRFYHKIHFSFNARYLSRSHSLRLSQHPSKFCLVFSLKDAAADVLSDKTIQEMRKVCLCTAPQSHEARLYELNIVIRAY